MRLKIMTSSAAVAALLAVGVAAPALAQPPTATPAAVPTNPCGFDITTTVHLRSGPGSRYASLGLLRQGDDVDLTGEKGGWYRVTLADRSHSGIKNGTAGWVSKQYIRPSVCTSID
ncbi:SH3 domain-containing protein [Streptomyces sp. NPDC048623]|uniref:SH3 domain-containing protein n=1 Tax=Streptomyces sp. NPDC048623 TaxID=3155761 RepID=UPI0034137F94